MNRQQILNRLRSHQFQLWPGILLCLVGLFLPLADTETEYWAVRIGELWVSHVLGMLLTAFIWGFPMFSLVVIFILVSLTSAMTGWPNFNWTKDYFPIANLLLRVPGIALVAFPFVGNSRLMIGGWLFLTGLFYLIGLRFHLDVKQFAAKSQSDCEQADPGNSTDPLQK